MFNPNPQCEKECRFSIGLTTRTAAYYQPIYDKHGNNTNPDMNTTTTSMGCHVCGKQWVVRTTNGEHKVEEVSNGNE